MFIEYLLAIIGMCVFEVVNSLDNAVINAQVLRTVPARMRHWFLSWGLIVAVFLVRGLFPFLLIFLAKRQFGGMGSVDAFAPPLLTGAAAFLFLLFAHWFFAEKKNRVIHIEYYFEEHSSVFYLVATALILFLFWLDLFHDHNIGYGALFGGLMFFIVHVLRTRAEQLGHMIAYHDGWGSWARIAYLEVLDAAFSVDGVLGAFAFTFSIPLIMIGNGLGALVVRWLTLRNINTVAKYKYLINGAMYSVGVLSILMLAEALGYAIPFYVAPITTLGIVSLFTYLSIPKVHKATRR